MRDISKNVVETILDGKLTDHLGYEKHDPTAKTTDNARNGFTPKILKSKFGEIDLEVPRDRKFDFEPHSPRSGEKTDLPAERLGYDLLPIDDFFGDRLGARV
jgi:transposase-like protein